MPVALAAGSSYEDQLEQAMSPYSERRDEEAAVLLRALTMRYPDRKEAFLWLGHAEFRLGHWEPAREAYKRYHELAPQDALGPHRVAKTYEAEGNRTLEEFWLRKVLDIESDNKEARSRVDQLTGGPDVPPPPAAGAPEDPDAGRPFLKKGLVGLCGARKVWWGKLIAAVIFGLGWMSGVVHTGIVSNKVSEMGGCGGAAGAFIGFLFGQSIWWILYWGVPRIWWVWCCMAGLILVGSALAAGVAATTKG